MGRESLEILKMCIAEANKRGAEISRFETTQKKHILLYFTESSYRHGEAMTFSGAGQAASYLFRTYALGKSSPELFYIFMGKTLPEMIQDKIRINTISRLDRIA